MFQHLQIKHIQSTKVECVLSLKISHKHELPSSLNQNLQPHPDLLQLRVVEILQGVDEGAFDVDVQNIPDLSNLLQSFTSTTESTA